ncbi:MAG: putative toxin-antitoxin system toxin component, PIN family [Candidatus Roizmanbacteria bacterium]|nr:putative toxin-antitoxin system toxin component, PIN family [Candidatus Roizmanbacteria bacterium]
MLLVLDTSTILSFLLSKRKTNVRSIIKLGYKKELEFAISQETYSELTRTIATNKTKKSNFYNQGTIGKFIVWYKYNSKKFEVIHDQPKLQSRDPNDNMFLTLAVKSKANYIITLDKDLIEVKKIDKTKIVTPSQFISEYSRKIS